MAKNKAKKPIDNKNQWDGKTSVKIIPAKALKMNPNAIQNISNIGCFFNPNQYAI